MGESRQELLAWLNNLLQLNVTKVEQCGTGAAFCQIYDSVFQDLPMNRVKFTVNTEYGYLQNFKILQGAFSRHGVERVIPIESLVKCKMQDNLEFLQWSKRYWDQYFPGGDYDALARRKAAGTAGPAAAAVNPSSAPSTGARRGATANVSGARPARVGGSTGGAGSGARADPGGSALAASLTQENNQLKVTVDGLEKERDFYFQKLRDIELLIQQTIEEDPEKENDEKLIKPILQTLYSTEDGFEIPADPEEEEGAAVAGEDQETF